MRASLTRTILATSVLALSVAAASAGAQSLMATPEEQRAYDDAREQKTVPKWLRDHGRECDELTKIYRAPTQGYLAAFDYQCSNGTIYKLGIVAGAEGQLVFRTDDDTKSSRPEVRTLPASSLGYVVEPNPIYPEDARRRGRQGNVMVRALVDIDGRSVDAAVQTSSGSEDLDKAAMSAVRAARFRPPVIDGKAQAVWVLVPINFVLRK